MSYKLLTPGPLTTTASVKQQMLEDRCTWDDEYKTLTQHIRSELLRVAEVDEALYTTVLMQGSGSFTVESVLTTAIGAEDKVLIITNGAYGERMVTMAEKMNIAHSVYAVAYDQQPAASHIAKCLADDAAITHVAMVHCETTTGILNDIAAVGDVVAASGKVFIVDAMSSFAGVPISFAESHIDYLISSANKCIQGVPGFGFVIVKREQLAKTKNNARSVSLDLYDQWQVMEADGKWRFTSPTHVVAAFGQALQELKKEGGVLARYARYKASNDLLRDELSKLGFTAYISTDKQSPIITTYLFPNDLFSFTPFYEEVKRQGYVLYPGKLTKVDTFRVGNIGDVDVEDMKKLVVIIRNYMEVL